jgi:hypothetical protein
MYMNKVIEKKGCTYQALEKGEVLCGQVRAIIDRLYVKHHESPLPEYLDVHLLVRTLEMMFPRLLQAHHGFIVDVAPVAEGTLVHKDWVPHSLISRTSGSLPLSVVMKQVPHSWLLHPESGTMVDVIPLGCKPGTTYPVCRPPHPDRPKYVSNTVQFKRLYGKLPDLKEVNELRRMLEKWSKDIAPAFIFA